MATYYVDGTNGNDAYDGTSATFVSGSTGPKKTLTAMEAKPVAAGDLVHVRPGTYRETLTCGVSGTAGNAIEYRGDYTGAIWTGGGVVRVTGSNNDQTATRANCIAATSKHYRTFTGFACDTTTGSPVSGTDCTDWTIQKCVFQGLDQAGSSIACAGSGQARWTVQQCVVLIGTALTASGVGFAHTVAVDNAAHTVQNCVVITGNHCVFAQRIGGVTVRNCFLSSGNGQAIAVTSALTAGQVITANNNIIYGMRGGFSATTTAEFVADYNALYALNTTRVNVNVGAHDVAYPVLLDPRWAFQLLYATAANQVVSPFDLSSYSQLINLAGTSPTTTDLRGTSAIGGTREWGALEYDSTLKIQGGSGGAVSIGPSRRGLGG